MADWLKVRHALVRSAKVRGLMRELRCKKHVALGVALNWLVWLDEQTDDGLTHLSPDELDEEIGFRGCTEAMISIGWAALGSDGCVEAVEFGKHCGESAKKRAENAARQANFKARHRSNAKSNAGGNTNALPDALPEEKRIEFTNAKVSSRATVNVGAAVPAAPPPPADSADGFGEWLGEMCGCVRAFREARCLHPEVVAEARAAYERFPRGVEYAPLLRAYYDSRLQEDKRRKEFWRPQGGRFFRELEDVVYKHAVRWQREVSWKPQCEVMAEVPVEGEEDGMTLEEKRAAMAKLREEVGL